MFISGTKKDISNPPPKQSLLVDQFEIKPLQLNLDPGHKYKNVFHPNNIL